MKRILSALILSIPMIVLYGQIQLEKAYSYSGTLTEIDEGEFMYFFMDVANKQCLLYNEDHTLYKTIDIFVPSGYFVYDMKFVSRKVFNDDNNIELLYIYSKLETINSEDVYSYGLRVIDETGQILLDLANGAFAELVEGSNGPRLLAFTYTWNESYYLVNTKIYTIGSPSTSVLEIAKKQDLLIYPNPANEYLTLDIQDVTEIENTEIQIINAKGSIVQKQRFDPGKKQSVNIQALTPGIYFLNVLSGNTILSAKTFEKN